MKIRYFSDAHYEFAYPTIIKCNPDDATTTLVVAGDLGGILGPATIINYLKTFSKQFKHVVYVIGNHEHYGHDFYRTVIDLKTMISNAGMSNVHLLDKESVSLDGITFIGATLWTDMNKNNPLDRWNLSRSMNDYNYIYVEDEESTDSFMRNINADDLYTDFVLAKKFIFDEIARTAGKFVVVTHHAPSMISIHKTYQGSNINSGFASDLSNEIIDADREFIWFHGHVHNSFDYDIGKCRILCNPRGYGNENELEFEDNATIEI